MKSVSLFEKNSPTLYLMILATTTGIISSAVELCQKSPPPIEVLAIKMW